MKKTLLYGLVILLVISCKTADPAPEVVCRLTNQSSAFDVSNYTYDANNNITKYTDSFTSGTDKIELIYTLTRNATGPLESAVQTSTTNGKLDVGANPQKFIYTNGLMTGINSYDADNKTIINTIAIKYDANKRMTSLDVVSSDGDSKENNVFEYDANGNYTKRTTTRNSISGGIKNQVIIEEYSYDTNKSAEQILTKTLPFDIIYNHPWAVNGLLTIKSTYIETTGAAPQIWSSKRTDVKVDANGYVTELTLVDDKDKTDIQKLTYSLDCK